MRGKRGLAIGTLAFGLLCTGAAQADEIKLIGTVRDFQQAHVDFENTLDGNFYLIQGIVEPQLGANGKPQLNAPLRTLTRGTDGGGEAEVTVTFGIDYIEASSTKDLSNAVLKLTDGTEYKYDELQDGTTQARFETPSGYEDEDIVTTWVKSGTHESGDGPGYGYRFDQADATDTTPEDWRIDSHLSFSKWFNNERANRSTPHEIVLDNGQSQPGGVYRFSRSTSDGNPFFPIDGQLSGNEGNSHNYHFTYEVNSRFEYTDPATRSYDLTFDVIGEDDIWVFVNDQLVIDLGGVHGEKWGMVNVDSMADELNLVPGEEYDLDLFFAERHTTDSSLTIETTIQLLPNQYD